jgi:hypothetical protein
VDGILGNLKKVIIWMINRRSCKMEVKKGFTSGFLILGFVIFIAGFLTGMLAIAIIPIGIDFTTLGLMFFILGFITGMVTIALVLVIQKLTELTRKSS